MKDHHLINYDLFCQRKKFNFNDYLKQNQEISYEEFCSFLRERKVQPPPKEFFDNELNKIFILENKKDLKEKEEKPKPIKKTRKKRKTKSLKTK